MSKLAALAAFVPLLATTASRGPTIEYLIHIDGRDSTGFVVDMQVQRPPPTMRLGAAVHPEYDDRFWRYFQDLTIKSSNTPLEVTRDDSAHWRVIVPTGAQIVDIHYRVVFPAHTALRRASWLPFVHAFGALVGAQGTFLYVDGYTASAPTRVSIDAPPQWRFATGLAQGNDARSFQAPSFDTLVDSPILMGPLREWSFTISGVPHTIAYLPSLDGVPFDTATMVDELERVARSSVAIFERPPYAKYTFLLQDGAAGALEHTNSLTLGAPSTELARDPSWLTSTIAHEFFHTWNLVRIRPIERSTPNYVRTPPTKGLWWSEGVTMYFARAMMLRAQLITDTTAQRRVADDIADYLMNPGNTQVSPEQASWSTGDLTANEGYLANYYGQGSLIGAMLDLVIRDSTSLRRSLDDVMRFLYKRYSGSRGFSEEDLVAAVDTVCQCQMSHFFDTYVAAAQMLPFDNYLRSAGLHVRVIRAAAQDSAGHPLPDDRLYVSRLPGSAVLRLIVQDPLSAWGRAGLRTGDELVAWNHAPIPTPMAFRTLLSQLRIGDTVAIDVNRSGSPRHFVVSSTGYDVMHVTIDPLPDRTPRQRAIATAWMRPTTGTNNGRHE